MNAQKNNPFNILLLPGEKRNRISVAFSQNGKKTITFTIKKSHRIVIDPFEGWMEKVPSEARDQIFELMLAHFRDSSSVNGNDIKAACIGVTETGEAYIAANTENRGDNGFNRDCAEQNMINTFRQLDKDPNKKIASIYLMGGRDEGAPSIICPCGSCVDTLAREMHTPLAPVIVFPVKSHEDKKTANLSSAATTIGEVEQGNGWKTTIGHLNDFRHIVLDPHHAQLQMQAMDEILDKICTEKTGALEQLHNPSKTPLHELATSRNCAKFSNYAQQRIVLALKNRVMNDPDFLDLSEPSERKEFLKNKIKSVQIAIAKLENGECFESISVKSDYDRASPGATSLAVLQNQMSNSPVTDLFYMEFDPAMNSNGISLTPKKEDVERTLKRSRADIPLTFHILPFVPLSQLEIPSAKVSASHFSAHALFPSYFTGNKPTPQKYVSNVCAQGTERGVPRTRDIA
jgi:cytidine deaminase